MTRGRRRDGLLEQCPGPHRITGIEVVLGRLHGSSAEVVTALNGGEPPAELRELGGRVRCASTPSQVSGLVQFRRDPGIGSG